MCNMCFDLSGIFVFIFIMSGISLMIIARLSILTLQDQLGDSFFDIFSKAHNSFPNHTHKRMNLSTQFTLYRVLFFNTNNIGDIVGRKQKAFVLIASINILLFLFILPTCILFCVII